MSSVNGNMFYNFLKGATSIFKSMNIQEYDKKVTDRVFYMCVLKIVALIVDYYFLQVENKKTLTKEYYSEESCSICYDEIDTSNKMDDIVLTVCKHLYHKKCLNKWLECKRTCPMCRFEL